LPDRDNCAFWLTHFPPDVTYKEVFDQIRNCGRIHEVHINNHEADNTRGAAAKVVFFDRQGANRFFLQHVLDPQRGGGAGRMSVRGWTVRCVRNRVRLIHREYLPADHTRVIRITGPRDDVNYERMIGHISALCHFDLEDAIMFHHPRATNLGDIEFRFARYDAQALVVWLSFNRDPYWQGTNPPITARFMPDPCDVQPLQNPAPAPQAQLNLTN
ncbi:hypothetical protein QBC37DRAFT_289273, partial [Rhypophila decipiens]